MKKYWFLLLLVTSFSEVKPQPALSDSLQQVLQNSPDDTTKVKRLVIAVQYLPYKQSESSLYYADSIIRLSEKIHFTYGLASGYLLKAESYIYIGDYSKAIFYIYQHLNLFKALGDRDEYTSYYQLSRLYEELGDYKKGLEYKLKGREIIISFGDSSYDRLTEQFISTASTMFLHDYNLADSYLNAGMTDSALKYGKRAFLANKS